MSRHLLKISKYKIVIFKRQNEIHAARVVGGHPDNCLARRAGPQYSDHMALASATMAFEATPLRMSSTNLATLDLQSYFMLPLHLPSVRLMAPKPRSISDDVKPSHACRAWTQTGKIASLGNR